jgi:hypothetical protein
MSYGRNDFRKGPPGGWANYELEQYAEDRRSERRKSDEGVKGRWVIISRYPGGTVMRSEKMTYVEAVRRVEKDEKRNIHIATKHNKLGRFNPTYELKKVSKWKLK